MRFAFLCAAVTLAAAPAFADELVARSGDDMVRLAETPCTSETVRALLKSEGAGYKAASARVEGQSYNGCWRAVGNVVHVVYEDGDQGIIPIADLKPELAV
jgi:hypothetical protein